MTINSYVCIQNHPYIWWYFDISKYFFTYHSQKDINQGILHLKISDIMKLGTNLHTILSYQYCIITLSLISSITRARKGTVNEYPIILICAKFYYSLYYFL